MESYGLALGGGGSKGAYEIGVWEALTELGIKVSGITGASIGSINGALFIQHDLNFAKELWLSLDFYKCFHFTQTKPTNITKLTLKHIPSVIKEFIYEKGIDITPFEKLLRNSIDEEKIRNSSIDFGLVTFSTTNLKPVEVFKEDIPKGKLIEYLMASCCFPGFKQVEIDGEKFIDGGVYNNIPADMLLRKNISTLITVNIHGPGNVKKFPKRYANVIEIECSEDLGPILNFDKQRLIRNMRIGYLDTLKAFKKVIGNSYYFYNEEIQNTSLLSPLSDNELKLLLKSINYKDLNTDNFFIIRVIRQLAKYTKKVPDGNTSILTALEITAELLNIERSNIYHYEELLDMVLKKALVKLPGTQNYKVMLSNENYLDLVYIDFDAFDHSDIRINIMKGLAALSPRHFICSMFISLIKYRLEKTKLVEV